MHIKKITYRNRRDFTADYGCEHCEHIQESYGYDDANFHDNVIPDMKCESCGKLATSAAPKLRPKYDEGVII